MELPAGTELQCVDFPFPVGEALEGDPALATPGDPEHVGLDIECGTELGIFGYGGE